MSKRCFTAEQEALIVARYQAGEGLVPISKTILDKPVSKTTIANTLQRLGIPLRASFSESAIPDDKKKLVVSLYQKGLDTCEVAARVGIGTTTVKNILHAAGVEMTIGRPKNG